jgi:hypothetical protein
LAKTIINELEWNSLLIPEDASSEEKEHHASVVSEYLSKQTNNQSVDLSSIDKTVEVEIDDSFLETEELELELISNNELFNFFPDEKAEIAPDILFPKTESIQALFWFLHHLGKEDISGAKILITNRDDLSIIFYRVVEAARFFGFLQRTEADEERYLVPTEIYENFMGKTVEMQYPLFLESLGRNETISEVLKIQLNDPIYDSISRQMVHNILVNDPNIEEEAMTNDEVNKIVNSLRYWYLAIKQTILKD